MAGYVGGFDGVACMGGNSRKGIWGLVFDMGIMWDGKRTDLMSGSDEVVVVDLGDNVFQKLIIDNGYVEF